MRILVISNLYPPVAEGGYERECARVVDRLRESGHDVVVLTSRRRQADGTQAPEHPGVVRALPWLTIDRRGRLRAPFASMVAAREARRVVAAHDPELVYVWNAGPSIPQAAVRVAADHGAPMAFRVCHWWFSGLYVQDLFMRDLEPGGRGAERLWRIVARLVNRLPSLRLVPAPHIRAAVSWVSEALRQTGFPPSVTATVEHVLYPASPSAPVFAAVERDPAPEPLLAYLGRVSEEKGVAFAIDALARLRADGHPTVTLAVAGPVDPGYGDELRRRAAELGVADAVDWRGPVGPQEAAALMGRAHAVVIPSVWPEPFGMVATEAALTGTPIVATAVGGIPEAVADGEQALLVPARDPDALAAALAEVLAHPAEAAARAARAREHAKGFGLEDYLEAQVAFVEEAHALGR